MSHCPGCMGFHNQFSHQGQTTSMWSVPCPGCPDAGGNDALQGEVIAYYRRDSETAGRTIAQLVSQIVRMAAEISRLNEVVNEYKSRLGCETAEWRECDPPAVVEPGPPSS